ncbi:DUF4426 domain-containing protein [Lysobacter yangpyeongensis]|uniref:DUF4426 domain-containing protein n=1 Tax=Lysobacter yangpyeongensis TaxID=346182 RepID=A0ABW0SL95_9GAMM
MRRLAFVLLLALALSACGGGNAPRPATAAPEEAVARSGDLTIRATAVPTSTLAAAVADRYGIARGDRTVLLLVGVRRGEAGQEVAVPAKITATATNLSGQRQAIALRELRSGDPTSGSGAELLDYIGTLDTDLPDTLRFELMVVPEGGTATPLQFSREFYRQ